MSKYGVTIRKKTPGAEPDRSIDMVDIIALSKLQVQFLTDFEFF